MTTAESRATTGAADEPSPPPGPGPVDSGFAPWVAPAYRFLRPALPLLGIYAVVRVGLLVVDILSAQLTFSGNLDAPMTRWDGAWFLRIAASWYPYPPPYQAGHHLLYYGPGAFGPVFPAFIRLLDSFGVLNPVQAAVTVSLVAGAVSVVLVWRLGCVLYDQRVGYIAGVLFIVMPGMAIVWGQLYSEGVGLALAAGCLLLIVRERWLWAGLVGAVATATNPMALPLALAAVVPAARSIRRHEVPRSLLTVVIVPMGFIAFVGYLGVHYHDAYFWWHLQKQAWAGTVDFGTSTVHLLWHPWSFGYQGKGWMQEAGALGVVGAVVALVRARPPLFLTVYCVGAFGEMFVSNELGFKPRVLTWAFPALIAVAASTRRRGWQPIAISFAFLFPLVFLAYSSYSGQGVGP